MTVPDGPTKMNPSSENRSNCILTWVMILTYTNCIF